MRHADTTLDKAYTAFRINTFFADRQALAAAQTETCAPRRAKPRDRSARGCPAVGPAGPRRAAAGRGARPRGEARALRPKSETRDAIAIAAPAVRVVSS